jgi:peptidyl-prolyl cis-trans isomerase A (cyclophilin A)
MRKFLLVLIAAVSCWAQTTSTQPAPKTTPKAPARKPAASPNKPAAPAAQGNPTAIMDTTAGKLTCELFQKDAPKTVANFIGLATGKKDWTDPKTNQKKHGVPLYNGTIFHRVIPNFMIQGGDPEGTGIGGPGYSFADEFPRDLHFDQPGRLAMANAGPNTNGSQFFITEASTPFLDPCFDEGGCVRGNRRVPKGSGYNLFGQCTPESVELVKQIARAPRNENDRPADPVKITSIKITGLPGTGSKGKASAHPATTSKKPAATTTTKKPQ